MNVVVTSLTHSIVQVADVFLVCVMFFFMFGIVGMQLYMGKFYSCNDSSATGIDECTGTFTNPTTGREEPRVWANAYYNFNNIGAAMLSLFVIATGDGYSQIVVDGLAI